MPDAAAAVPTRANGGISADGKTITYRLRKNAVFSDGAPLTASDVAFTWRQVLNKNNNVANHFPYDLAESVTAKDPQTVVVRLREPNAAFAAFFMRCGTQGSILPEHLLRGKHDLNRDPFNRQPVGSGPFVVTAFQPGVVVELARNPHWWGKRPALDRITYRIIPNENSLLVALRTHEIDFYYAAPEQQYRELRGLAGVHVSARPFAAYEQVTFNTRRAPFDDVRVRRAAAQVIDWDVLQRSVYLAVDLPGVTDVFPLSWAFDPSVKPYPHDLGAARKLLDAAGWKARPRRHSQPGRQAHEHHAAHGRRRDPAPERRGADPARAARGRLRGADPQRAGQPAVRAASRAADCSPRATSTRRSTAGPKRPTRPTTCRRSAPTGCRRTARTTAACATPRSAGCSAKARACTSARGASPPISRCSGASTSSFRSRRSSGEPTSTPSATTSAASARPSR